VLDARFFDAVEAIRAPLAGTELMGPLLYSLLRSGRPRSVVEVGMGYTTPFLLQALYDNRQDFLRERRLLREKVASLPEAGGLSLDEMTRIGLETAPAPALDPAHYLVPYEPHLYAFDDLSDQHQQRSALGVVAVVRRLGLDPLLTFVNGDPCGQTAVFAKHHLPIDLVWHDADRPGVFMEEYWDLINPSGGMFIVHNTVNSWSSNAATVKKLKLRQAGCREEIEILSLVEPHKLNQRSCTMVRKIACFPEVYLETRRGEVARNAFELLKQP
jgi:hypothetical protein